MGPLATTIWIICYFAVLLGLAGYGIHRYTMIFLYWRNRRKKPEPQSEFKDLPSVTVQLPIFNELAGSSLSIPISPLNPSPLIVIVKSVILVLVNSINLNLK